MKPPFLLTLCFSLTASCCMPAWSQQPNGGRHALILCNQNYQAIGPLRTTLAEAREAEKTLATLGFAGNITVVTDATTTKMMEAVDTFATQTAKAEVALFFYGGHAIQAGGENYLLGVDSDPATSSQLAYKALPLGRVLTDLEGSGSRLNLLILDCCRDNPLPTRGRSVGNTRGLAAVSNAPKGTFIAYAADANQQAWDDHGSIGLYGSVLFEKMKTPGLRLEDIFIQTREEVARIATEKYQHEQEPAEYSKVSGAFYFQSAPQTPVVVIPTVSAPEVKPPQPQAPLPSPMVLSTPPASPAPDLTPAAASSTAVASTPPEPSGPTLPARGYHDLSEVFDGTGYDSHNAYSRSGILKKAQEKLKAGGLYRSAPDGAMGPGTQQAIIAYQRQHGLPVTGRIDSATQDSLGLTGIPERIPAPATPTKPSSQRPAGSMTPDQLRALFGN